MLRTASLLTLVGLVTSQEVFMPHQPLRHAQNQAKFLKSNAFQVYQAGSNGTTQG
jgi:hypothetical protein